MFCVEKQKEYVALAKMERCPYRSFVGVHESNLLALYRFKTLTANGEGVIQLHFNERAARVHE